MVPHSPIQTVWLCTRIIVHWNRVSNKWASQPPTLTIWLKNVSVVQIIWKFKAIHAIHRTHNFGAKINRRILYPQTPKTGSRSLNYRPSAHWEKSWLKLEALRWWSFQECYRFKAMSCLDTWGTRVRRFRCRWVLSAEQFEQWSPPVDSTSRSSDTNKIERGAQQFLTEVGVPVHESILQRHWHWMECWDALQVLGVAGARHLWTMNVDCPWYSESTSVRHWCLMRLIFWRSRLSCARLFEGRAPGCSAVFGKVSQMPPTHEHDLEGVGLIKFWAGNFLIGLSPPPTWVSQPTPGHPKKKTRCKNDQRRVSASLGVLASEFRTDICWNKRSSAQGNCGCDVPLHFVLAVYFWMFDIILALSTASLQCGIQILKILFWLDLQAQNSQTLSRMYFQVLGFEVDPINSVQFSNHKGIVNSLSREVTL